MRCAAVFICISTNSYICRLVYRFGAQLVCVCVSVRVCKQKLVCCVLCVCIYSCGACVREREYMCGTKSSSCAECLCMYVWSGAYMCGLRSRPQD